MDKFKCPKCGEEIEISEALKHQIAEETEKDLELKIRQKLGRENELQLEDLKRSLDEKDKKINDLRDRELEIREEKRKLEDAKRELELETQRKIDEERARIEEHTTKRLLDEHHLKDLEKEKKISDMEKLIEELRRTSRQGSMQTQGEVGELELEKILKSLFPADEISEVKKGELGGDVRQTVKSMLGTECGLILWERKRTKGWIEDWVNKLKEDLHRDKAQLGVIVTDVLPKDFKKQIGEKKGIWITTSEFVEPVAMLLRKILYDVAKEKSIKNNKQSRAEEVYDLIKSGEFTMQVDRLMNIYMQMHEQIAKERAVAERQWKMRESQVNNLISGVSGIFGSIEGIAGNAIPPAKSLELADGETNQLHEKS